jgi:hypothetical protein
MKVEMTGKMQFFVESAGTEGSKYQVDMEENYPNGKCSCTDFGTRCQKVWNEVRVVEEYTEPKRTRCKHINAVIMWLGNAVINRAAH